MSLIKLNFIPKTKIDYIYRVTIMNFIAYLNRCEADEINLKVTTLNKDRYIIDVSNNTEEKQWIRIEHQKYLSSIMEPWDWDLEKHEAVMDQLNKGNDYFDLDIHYPERSRILKFRMLSEDDIQCILYILDQDGKTTKDNKHVSIWISDKKKFERIIEYIKYSAWYTC